MAEDELIDDKKEDAPKFEYCESCGVNLKTQEDHGGKDIKNSWCKDCCTEDGKHKSKEEVKKHIIKDVIMGHEAPTVMGERIQEPEEAAKLAEDYMKRMPAWEVKEENPE
jgi:hypothetical protein